MWKRISHLKQWHRTPRPSEWDRVSFENRSAILGTGSLRLRKIRTLQLGSIPRDRRPRLNYSKWPPLEHNTWKGPLSVPARGIKGFYRISSNVSQNQASEQMRHPNIKMKTDISNKIFEWKRRTSYIRVCQRPPHASFPCPQGSSFLGGKGQLVSLFQ